MKLISFVLTLEVTMDATKVSTTVPMSYSSFGANQFTEMLMSNLVLSKMGDCLKDQFTFNIKTIVKLLILLSLNELRAPFGDGIKALVDKIKNTSNWLFPILTYLLQLRHSKMFKSQKTEPEIPSTIKEGRLLELEIDENFLTSIYNYLQKPSSCSYIKQLSEVCLKNAKEQIFKENYSDIRISIGSDIFHVDNNLEYSINICTGEIVAVGSTAIIKQVPKDITSYLDLLTREQREIIKMIKSAYVGTNDLPSVIKSIKRAGDYTGYFTEDEILKLLLNFYPKLSKDDTVLELFILIALCTRTAFMTNIISHCKNNGILVFDPYNDYTGKISGHMEIGTYAGNNAPTVQQIAINAGIRDWQNKFSNFYVSGVPTVKNAKLNTLSLRINSTSSLDVAMKIFVQEIYKHSKRVNDTIKIYYLSLENEIKTDQVSNPEYEQWEQKKDMLEKIKADVKILAELTIPPKTLTKETIVKKIVTKQLNEVEKDMDTLYLREKDMKTLLSCISQFRDKKDVVKGLGLPNKLNVLLYGLPGVGKSTAIAAIATYMHRDIYYVDLKDAETNADLQMIFEHVNKNVPNSGIVVLEDIDAMTDVVLKRTSQSVPTKSRSGLTLDHKTKLTLDYFLNVLQGTLTLDNSIFLVTTNHIEHLDPAFYRDGRFDLKIELKLCDHYQINAIYRRMLSRDVPMRLLQRIKEDSVSPASLIYHIKNYMFVPDTPDEVILQPYLT